MTKAELESKHLAELHALAAEAGVPRYRMLRRGELVEALLAAGDKPKKAPPSRGSRGRARRPAAPPRESGQAAETSPPSTPPPRRRRRRRFGRKSKRGGVREHANRWLEAWNSHDLEAIVACYAEDVEFVIPSVVSESPEERLNGREALRTHVRHGLELAPNLTVTEESLLVGPGGFAILYRREDGHRAIEAVELDEFGLAAKARVYYEREQS
jgi:SnoaL-like domain/Rho termination factor, N-terminal domain